MGSRGMKQRGRQHLPKVHNGMSAGDQQRLFGRFRWGAYSPAGNLERNGFFWRQVSRQRGQERGRAYRAVAYVLLASSLALLAIAAIGLVLAALRWVL